MWVYKKFFLFHDLQLLSYFYETPWCFTKFSFHHKLNAIITYKHGMYALPHQLPNDLRLR